MSEKQLPELEEDHYVTHLAEVNEKNEVISTQDIVNENGVLLCRKGMRISRKIAERLVDHKLAHPLEDTVQLSNSISNTTLYSRLLDLLEKYPDLKQIQDQLNFSQECKNAFIKYKLHPILIQKLSVIQEQLPEQLDKGVFCAWLATLTAHEMGMDNENIRSAFIAGLTHDMGFIHISPDILNKQGEFTPEEWRAIQSHVVVGQMILKKLSDIPPGASSAVLEHHERCDGSGYPLSKNDENLSRVGQVIGIVDSIHSIRVKQFEPRKRNLMDLMPWLHMNSKTHYLETYQTLTGILKKSGLKVTPHPESDIGDLARKLRMRGEALKEAIDLMNEHEVLSLIDGTEKTLVSKSMYKVTDHVLTMTNQSGMVKDELFTWLKNLETQSDTEALSELNEIELMLNELQWQVSNACKVYQSFLSRDKSFSTRCKKIKSLTEQVQDCIKRLQA